MKIFELFDELQHEVESSKNAVFGKKKLDAQLVGEILEDMRAALPPDLATAQKIIENEQQIIEKAKEKAQNILDGVDTRLNELIEEHKVTQLAYEKSNRLIDIAQKQAAELRSGSTAYAVDVLDDIISYLKEYIDIVNENKQNFINKKHSDQSQSTF
jgi:vacuolar-type H+-ATPase subunit H